MPSANCFPEGNQEPVKQLHPVLQPPPGLPPPSLKTPSSAILEALARVQADCASQALDAAILAATAKPSMTHSRQNSKSWCESWSQASTASEEPEDLRDFEDKVKPKPRALPRRGAHSCYGGLGPNFQPGQPAYVTPAARRFPTACVGGQRLRMG
mmetsp:Transcript_24378/g.57773  ORF Transcript_24378/g.57773 Transcript_24378/m.57773 type:complete len:155 (+) Transcript_24378:62-526(+)